MFLTFLIPLQSISVGCKYLRQPLALFVARHSEEILVRPTVRFCLPQESLNTLSEWQRECLIKN